MKTITNKNSSVNMSVDYNKSRKQALLSIYPCVEVAGCLSVEITSGTYINLVPMARDNKKKIESISNLIELHKEHISNLFLTNKATNLISLQSFINTLPL